MKMNTKSKLMASMLVLVLCVTAFFGSTYAWFTDSVTSSGNKIQAGNLDVQLLMHDGTEYVDISDSTNPIIGKAIFGKDGSSVAQNNNGNTLWEPGKTQVAYLKIKNNGNLALKYNVTLLNVEESGLEDPYKMSDVMYYAVHNDVTANEPITAWTGGSQVQQFPAEVASYTELAAGGEHSFALAIHMDENADNNYQNGQIAFDIKVFATQKNAESDSFGDDYDVNAPETADLWDGTTDTDWYNDTDTEFTLSTAEELAGFVALANAGNKFSGKTIELDTDVDMAGEQWTPIKKFAGKLEGNEHTISNYSIDATTGHGGFIDVLEWGTIKDLTLTDVTATVGDYRFGALARSINQSNIDNVTVKNVNVTTTASKAFVAGLFCEGIVNSNMKVNNCTVEDFTVNAENGAMLIGGITDFVQKNGTEAEGTNIFENLNVKNFKVIANDTDGYCNIGGLVGQTQSVWQNPRFNNCSVSGLDVTATGTVNVGGFMCAPGSYTYAENCTTEGKIDVTGVTSADYYAGGFFGDYGWGDNVGKGDHKVTNCSADVDITTKIAPAGGFVGAGINTEGRNKNITLTNCEAKGTVTLVEGGTANIGGFAGQTDRGIYINCTAAQNPFIGKVLDGYTLIDDGNGTLTVTK